MRSARSAELAIPEWIATRAAADPDAVALLDVTGAMRLSFGALAERVELLARRFRQLGIGGESRVAVSLADGPETLTVLLALMSVAAIAPVHPTTAVASLDALVERLGISAVVGGSRPASAAWRVAEARGLLYVEVEGEPSRIGSARLTPHRRLARPSPEGGGMDDAALFITTSGTTGRSSTVAITRRSLDRNVAVHAELNGYGPATRALCVMGFSYLFAYVRASLPILRAGGAVAVAPGYRFADLRRCCDAVRPTVMAATPTILQKLIADAEAAGWRPEPGVLRRFHATGEAIPDALRTRLREVFDAGLGTNYGMTEVSPQVAACAPEDRHGPGAVGRIVPPWRVDALDEDGGVLPPGGVGRLALRGGYVNAVVGMDEETRFDAAGRFLTGDRGFVDAAGVLHVAGRVDDVINRGGEKIDPRTIESALERDPDVARAVAFGVPDPEYGQRILGLIVRREGAVRGVREIREAAGARIAGWATPERLVEVPEIPTNANGKVSRSDLARRFADG